MLFLESCDFNHVRFRIEAYNSKPMVVGRWTAGYAAEIYAESELKSDIFPDEHGQDLGGSIT